MNCFCRGNKILVETNKGSVKGSKMKTRKGKKIFAFRGIPYAKPPVGKLRFRRSEPAEPWEGLLDGTKESKKSYQPNVLLPESAFREGREDCLYLNVYTKSYPSSGDGVLPDQEPPLLPVLVFLHGGAFVVGSCEAMLYGPQVLLDREVVLVGVNYRLGALGFLSLETEEAPGNLGLHDQFLALCWVRDNIAQFGGDPDNVTLLGESAGAMSAVCHLVSPIPRGLFHRVISLSGSQACAIMHNDRSPRCYALALATKLGYSGDETDSQSLLSFLQSQSAVNIVKKSIMFADWDYANPMPWTPSLDTFSSQPFLPLSFTEAVKAGKVSRVPVMFGLCKDEGLILSAPFYQTKERWELLRQDWTNWAPLVFFGRERELTTDRDREVASDIGSFYFGEETKISGLASDEETLRQLTKIYTMSYFYSAAHHDSTVLAQAGLPVHVFILSHPPAFSLMDMFRLNIKQLFYMFACRAFGFNPYYQQFGVCHGDDLNYLFPMDPPGFPPTVVTEDQKQVQRHLMDIVSSFASSGDPSTTEEIGSIWEPVQAETGISKYLKVDAPCTMENDQDLRRELNFWSEIRAAAKMDHWELKKEKPCVFHNTIAFKRQQQQ